MEVIKGFVTRVNSFKFYLYISPVANTADELKGKVLWSIKYLSEFLTDSQKSLIKHMEKGVFRNNFSKLV